MTTPTNDVPRSSAVEGLFILTVVKTIIGITLLYITLICLITNGIIYVSVVSIDAHLLYYNIFVLFYSV